MHTEKNKSQLQDIIHNDKPIHVIPHGLIKMFQRHIKKEEARHFLKLSDEDRILLCFGHIRPYKGLKTAIQAISMLKDENIKLIIAGKCWEDWNHYQEAIDSYKLTEQIKVHNRLIPNDEIEIYFTAADLLLLPYTHFDAQSGVASLAMSYRVPMIVSNLPGLTDLVQDENFVFEPMNTPELAKKISAFFNTMEGKDAFHSGLNDEYLQSLEWPEIALKTIQVYKNV